MSGGRRLSAGPALSLHLTVSQPFAVVSGLFLVRIGVVLDILLHAEGLQFGTECVELVDIADAGHELGDLVGRIVGEQRVEVRNAVAGDLIEVERGRRQSRRRMLRIPFSDGT